MRRLATIWTNANGLAPVSEYVSLASARHDGQCAMSSSANEVWLVVSYEPIPGVDGDTRLLRFGLLAKQLSEAGMHVVFWTSTFDHVHKRQRSNASFDADLAPGITVRFIYAPAYRRNKSIARWQHNRALARAFRIEADAGRPKPAAIVACLHAIELSEACAQFAELNSVPLWIDIVDRWPDVYLTAAPIWLRRVFAPAVAD